MILHKGETLFRQGEAGPLFRLLGGMLKIMRLHPDGNVFIVNIIAPGEIIPHHSLISAQNYHGTAIAMVTSEVEVIEPGEWYRQLAADPAKCLEAARLLQSRLRMLQQRIDQLSHIAPRDKLLSLKRWFESHLGPYELTDLLTQEEIGQFIGLRRETVNRLLKSLQAKSRPDKPASLSSTSAAQDDGSRAKPES